MNVNPSDVDIETLGHHLNPYGEQPTELAFEAAKTLLDPQVIEQKSEVDDAPNGETILATQLIRHERTAVDSRDGVTVKLFTLATSAALVDLGSLRCGPDGVHIPGFWKEKGGYVDGVKNFQWPNPGEANTDIVIGRNVADNPGTICTSLSMPREMSRQHLTLSLLPDKRLLLTDTSVNGTFLIVSKPGAEH